MSVPPGFYPDGVTPGVERWFDGTAWHEVTRPVVPPAGGTGTPGSGWVAPPGRPDPWPSDRPDAGQGYPAPQQWSGLPPGGPPGQSGQPGSWSALGPQDPAHWLVPVGRSWQSIAAGYLGLFGLFLFVTAPFAVWMGVWALRLAKQGGHGSGRAWFGIVTGVIGTVLGIWVLIAVLR